MYDRFGEAYNNTSDGLGKNKRLLRFNSESENKHMETHFPSTLTPTPLNGLTFQANLRSGLDIFVFKKKGSHRLIESVHFNNQCGDCVYRV